MLETLGCLVAGNDAGIADSVRDYVLAQAALLPCGQQTTVALAGLAHPRYIAGLELSDAALHGTVNPEAQREKNQGMRFSPD